MTQAAIRQLIADGIAAIWKHKLLPWKIPIGIVSRKTSIILSTGTLIDARPCPVNANMPNHQRKDLLG
ncbi:hypothetical protein Tco_0161520 [Tanacetum coccineum]